MIVHARRVAACVALAAVPLAGCSSSGAARAHTSAPPPSPHSTAGTTSPSTTGTPTPSGTPADVATTQAVKTAYATFFSSNTTPSKAAAALQHGSDFLNVLQAESNSSQAQSVQVTVTGVNLLRSDVALVTFTIASGGVKLPNTRGYAVKEGNRWKVAAQTFCNLLQLQGNAPTVCKDSSVTALPH